MEGVLASPGRTLHRHSLGLGATVLSDLPRVPTRRATDRLASDAVVGPVDDAMEREAHRVASAVGGHSRGAGKAEGPSGFDLSLVRIHTDPRAAWSAHVLGARAYAVGRHVVFGEGQYRPDTLEGGRLIAHELTHVAQQLSGAEPPTVRGQFYKVERRGLGEFAGGKNVPRRSLPRRRSQGPMMREKGTEVVRGFPLKKAHCGCESLIASELQGIEERIQAYEACAAQEDMTLDELQPCVRRAIYGNQVVPAGGHADPEKGAVDWPTEAQLERRAAALGQPAHGPCAELRSWGTLVHETGHLRDFEAVAQSIDPTFAKELDKLRGDRGRLDTLSQEPEGPAGSRSFAKEAAEYKRRTFRPTVDFLKTSEVQSYQRERRFWYEVRAALARICAPPEPRVKQTKSRRPYGIGGTPRIDDSLKGP